MQTWMITLEFDGERCLMYQYAPLTEHSVVKGNWNGRTTIVSENHAIVYEWSENVGDEFSSTVTLGCRGKRYVNPDFNGGCDHGPGPLTTEVTKSAFGLSVSPRRSTDDHLTCAWP